MRENRVSRWFASGIVGTLFAISMLALAAPVAADGLVTTVPGQDLTSNVIVVASPGYIANNTAAVPPNINNGFAFCTANACYPAGTVIQGNTICTVNGGCIVANANCAAFGCGTLGYTAAGPVVAIDQNGNRVVYDVRSGDYETLGTDANGRVCEVDSRGNCQP